MLVLVLFVGDAVLNGRPLTSRGLLQPVDRLNFAGMRLGRDMSRAKARQRRFGEPYALMPLLMGTEKPLPLGNADAGLALTLEELEEYDGRPLPRSGEPAPLYLAVLGRIYDVSKGAAFYGPGRSYHKLVAKDASRAFCTGCLEPECLIASLDGLSPDQRKEAFKWIELYEHHDKYKLVGRVRNPNNGASEEEREEIKRREAEWEAQQVEMAQEAESRKTYRPFKLR